jgi:DNA-binding phage protein
MALTRSFRDTVMRHVKEDPAFRAALIEEAYRNVLDGDRRTALGQMRDVVNATIGFDGLAKRTGVQKTSLMRMLGGNGNPRAENLLAILQAIGEGADVRITVHAEAMAAA